MGYLEALMKANIGDIQSSAATRLAESMKGASKKEKWLRTISGLGKGIFKFIDPTGGILGAGLDVVLDPLLRSAGLGAKESDIKLDKEYQIFGGKKALETAKEGLTESKEDYRQSSLINALLGFGGSKVGGALLDRAPKGKWDWLGGGRNNLPNVGRTGADAGNLADALDDLYTQGARSSQGGWLDKLFGESNVVRSGGRGYEQGGMVQKYQEGGQIRRTQLDVSTGQQVDVWDTYTYDGLNWSKDETGLTTNPNLQNITKGEMDKWRDEGRTASVGSSYMETTSELGLNEFLRTPAVYKQLEKARGGDAYAMENFLEMLRQMRPEMANKTNEELRTALGKILPNIDLYGEGYQETLSGTETTLEGLVGEAQTVRGQVATQKATSGIRTPGSGDTISEALYSGAEDVYAGMQKDIQTGFEEEFKPLETMFTSVS